MKPVKDGVKYFLWRLLQLIGSGHDVAQLRVLSGLAKAVRMEFDLRKEGSYWLGTYDRWVLNRIHLERLIKPGQVAWDCGAYIGYYTAILRLLVGETGRVITFEASSTNYRRVARLPELNGWTNVKVLQKAIGPDHSIIEFVSNLGGSCGPFRLSKKYSEEETLMVEKVPCAGLDELVYEQGLPLPDFLKLDLETAEEFALHNGPKLFGTKRPLLQLELHGDVAAVATARFLQTFDYAAWDVLQLPLGTPPLRSPEDMEQRPPQSHMLLCVPAERSREISKLLK